ncbi:ATP-binding protein [Flavivirga jejuensis]|uniref:ATP-binding protein n=1 Tax=Flavivirga jejuensis TaxID=870487 RepID=A0ABT8WQD4_9FLAO|nr:ATP-binding protein [Flavivirga jejuensis]MDO5975204.1 ATP-binding protein [Flavivirga jejuensis]
MITTEINNNINILFSFLKEVILWRLENLEISFDEEAPKIDLTALPATTITSFLINRKVSQWELVTFLIALSPNIKPSFLLDCIAEAFPNGTDLPQFGGVKGKQHRGIIPTGETIQFILGGNNTQDRIQCMSLFSATSTLEKRKVLFLEKALPGEPVMSGKVLLYPESFSLATTGVVPPPKMSAQFPAEKLETGLAWEDLVLNDSTSNEVKELKIWLKHSVTFLEDWGMKNRVKSGFRVLFHGPPGTGKTLTASLLGKYINRDVFRIDLSTVVSKYIGETEKNLSNLFDKAAHKDWILFFDEADAIFGKRTNVKDAHDKYANQEVSYLLQRVESHSGLVILATNFKENIDEAFMRRFQSICEFHLPASKERLILWQSNLPKQLKLDHTINLGEIAEKYEVSGSNIMNIIQHCSLKVLNLNSTVLTLEILLEGIKKEYIKEGRLF